MHKFHTELDPIILLSLILPYVVKDLLFGGSYPYILLIHERSTLLHGKYYCIIFTELKIHNITCITKILEVKSIGLKLLQNPHSLVG